MWSSIALPAIIATSVTILVNAGADRVWRLLVRAWTYPRSDHLTLTSEGITSDMGALPYVRCLVRCAPSRRIRSPKRVDHDAVSELVAIIAPDLPDSPYQYDKDGLRFQIPDLYSDHPASTVNVRASGLIEFASPLPEDRDEERFWLSLEDVAARIAVVVELVRNGHYRRMFGTRRRLDWSVSVSGYIQVRPTNQTLHWTDLTSAGHPLGQRASGSRPAIATGTQFGAASLINVRQRTTSGPIVRGVFTDWLDRCGYWRPETEIESVISRIGMSNAAQPPTS